MLPGLLGVAAEGDRVHLLGPVQLTQGGGEQQGGVVHQGGLRLKTILVADPSSRVLMCVYLYISTLWSN